MLKHLLGVLFVLGALVSLRAQQPFDVTVPSTLIAFYDRTTAQGCLTGWTELTAARGAALVGLTNGGTKGTLVGTALTDQEDRAHDHTMAHAHTLNAHNHGFPGTTGPPSATRNVEDQFPSGSDAASSSHTHPTTVAGTANSDATGGASAGTGNQSTTIAPYLQLLFCVKS